MPFQFISLTARATWAGGTSQQGQLTALAALWAGQVAVRYYTSAGAHLATVTHEAWIIDTATTPRSLKLGAWVAESHFSGGTAAYCVCAVPSGDDILRADVALAGAISDPGGRVRVDIGTTLRIEANGALDAVGLPAWLPSAGEIAVLTAGANLANNFADIISSTHSVNPSVEISHLFNSYALNVHWGSYGALIGFGGGHAQTNDNSVWALEFGASTNTFKRLTTPTDWGISTADNDTGAHTISANYGENFDGQPAAPHSYAALDVFGTESGGAAAGTFVVVTRKTVAYGGIDDYTAAHAVDFANTAGAAGSYSWYRYSENYVAGNGLKPAWSCYVPAVGAHNPRIYYETFDSSATKPKWFDLTAGTYGDNASGTSRLDTSGGDGGILFYVPSREILVFMDGASGAARAQYMDVTATNPSWVTSVTLSASIPAANFWGCACWCSDNNKIIVGAVDADPNCIYEITIPATLSDSWACERVAFPSGQVIPWLEVSATSGSMKRMEYNPLTKCIAYFPYGAYSGNDSVYAYRPRGT